MSNLRIIYPDDDGNVAILTPAPEWLAQEGNTIEALAAKDVPLRTRAIPTGTHAVNDETGETYEVHTYVTEPRPWRIVKVADIPTDGTFRAAGEFVE